MDGWDCTGAKAFLASLPDGSPEPAGASKKGEENLRCWFFCRLMSISGEGTGIRLSPTRPSADQRQETGMANRYDQTKMRRIKPTVFNKYRGLWKI